MPENEYRLFPFSSILKNVACVPIFEEREKIRIIINNDIDQNLDASNIVSYDYRM